MSEDTSKKLDFSLPDQPQAKPARSGGVGVLLVVLILLVGGNLFLTWSRGGGGVSPAAEAGDGLDAAALKQLALKLEKQGLGRAAAGAWGEYLEAPDADPDEAAAIWYRIGTIHQDADAHEDALAAFYRSESVGDGGDLAADIGRRVQESLEALGKFAALKHELAGRVGLDEGAGEASGEVLAEIGPRKITRLELDRQIEAVIENQLAMYAGQLTDAQRQQQKEAMLKQFAGDQQRMQFLNQFVVEELLYRKARDTKMMEDPEVRTQLQEAERSLLARRFMEAELAERIHITDGDLSTYHGANQSRYVEPASAGLGHILVTDEEAAKKVIAEIMAGGDFAALAKEHSLDEATREQGGVLADRATRGQPVPGLAVPVDALAAVFEAKAGDILDSPVQSDAGFHVIRILDRKDERPQPFDEVRTAVYRDLRTTKEREVREQLLETLRDEYDVVIHQEAMGTPPPTTK